MPTIKDLSPVVSEICQQVRQIGGVTGVYIWGSYLDHKDQPNYVVKDLDVIASTSFDSGDLLAIDNSKYSALKIRPDELEDEGFNPQAVSFTKRFLDFNRYNVDHWASSSDGKLLHWGAIPDNQEEWAELHAQAEKRASKATGVKRADLRLRSDEQRKSWKQVYDQYITKYLESNTTGWYPSDHLFADILSKALKME